MAHNKSSTYADADEVRSLMERTHSPRVMGVGGSGGGLGLFRLDYDEALFQRNYDEPVLAARAGGVAARQAIARATGRYDTLGADLVAACVNALICVGAEPLFFLPGLLPGELGPERVIEVVTSIAQGCSRAGCSLLGGGVMSGPGGEGGASAGLSGFAVGVVERRRLLDGTHTRAGDVVIGLASDGLHGQGLGLAWRVLCGESVLPSRLAGILLPAPGEGDLSSSNNQANGTHNAGGTPAPHETPAAQLLRPARLYAPSVLEVVGAYRVKRVVKAMAHIDGGLGGPWTAGLPDGLAVRLRRGSWDIPPIFRLLAERGPLNDIDMFHTFNMGIGFVMIVAPNFAKPVMARLRRHGERCGVIGKIVKGEGGIEWA